MHHPIPVPPISSFPFHFISFHQQAPSHDLTRKRSSIHSIHSLRIIQHTQIIHPRQIPISHHPTLRRQRLITQHLEIIHTTHLEVPNILLQRHTSPIPSHRTIQRRSRQGKDAPSDLLSLLLRPPRRPPHLAQLLQPAQAEPYTVARAVPLRALEDVGAGGEVRERRECDAADSKGRVLEDRDRERVEVDGAFGCFERFLGVDPVGAVFVP